MRRWGGSSGITGRGGARRAPVLAQQTSAPGLSCHGGWNLMSQRKSRVRMESVSKEGAKKLVG